VLKTRDPGRREQFAVVPKGGSRGRSTVARGRIARPQPKGGRRELVVKHRKEKPKCRLQIIVAVQGTGPFADRREAEKPLRF